MLRTAENKDLRLREAVEAALEDDPSVVAAGIGVSAVDGVVTLTGQVDAYWRRTTAERAAERIRGVRGIVNRIEVHVAGDHSDTEVATAVLEALARNSQVPPDRVIVRVLDGWVTLSGELDHDYQRRAAARTAQNVPGVRGMANGIRVLSPVHTTEVRKKIEQSFARQALIDAGNVTVTVHDHKVELHGWVRSWAERRQAENAAAAMPGVANVENHLEVRP